MDTGSGDQLFKAIGRFRGPEKETRKKENDGANENCKPYSDKCFGARPRKFMRNGQNEKQVHSETSFKPSSFYTNSSLKFRRGGPHTVTDKVFNFSKSSNCRRNQNEPVSRFSGQNPLQLLAVRDPLKSLQEKEKKKLQPDNEGVPGFQIPQIKELLKMDSTELLMDLTARLKDFISLLNQKLNPEMIMLVVKMYAQVSSSEMKENQAALLAHSIQPSVLDQFSSHSFNIIAQNLKYSPAEIIEYFENLYTLYQDVVEMLPAKASEVLRDHSTRAVMALKNMKAMRKVSVPTKLEQDYDILMASMESLIKQHKSAVPKISRDNIKREWEPRIDFRKVSIHPLPQDVLRKSNINLYPLVIEGPYKSVEHYLDVQFHLMREDFLIPLRNGIANFIEQKSSKTNKFKRIENVRFYNNVRFLNQYVEGDAIITEVLFNPRAKLSGHNWKRSKRFLYGSLLCFTSDLFCSIILGTIVDRQVNLLEKGILRCELIGDVNNENLFKREFIMVENEVYFEAYQHVLRVLQNFNEDNFPLPEYIINVSSSLHLPSYLSTDFQEIYKYEGYEFVVRDQSSWPQKLVNELKVNESQFRALHSALTKKCAVIQGPPGTGKTYLGLIIAKLLLQNSSHWRKDGMGRKGPMLVVCFTNHALDQFLEGMLMFTKNIVRVGSQSKNEKLTEYNIRVIRKAKGIKIYGLGDTIEELEEQSQIVNYQSNLLKECFKNAGILSLEFLDGYFMKESHRLFFNSYGPRNNAGFIEWLLEGAYFQNFADSNLSMEDIEPIPKNMENVYACTLQGLKHFINELHTSSLAAKGFEQESINNVMMIHVNRFHYMKSKLMEPFEPNVELLSRISAVKNLNGLHPEARWTLYKYWVSQKIEIVQDSLTRARLSYQELNGKKLKMFECMNLATFVECDVVGITTTGAAKHQSLLQKLGSKIVIVEEAAEAMESHIVACLSSKCEHLILIGDQKQLRPSPAVYKLARDYHLEISLFERLLMNGISYDTLSIQHRMRPDIADMVFPAVYPVLHNHPSVVAYSNIIGLKNNLYFITHSHLEEKTIDDLSKRNPHEAKFLMALCRHIVLQGYEPSQITILTTYLGQMFLLTEEREKYQDLTDVRIAVVDNFQGEENDIILLSLVRNNDEGKIGFLASENRTCVSLSRAKLGLYIIGNIDMLAEKSHLWSQIEKVLRDKEAVGPHLTLQCIKHPDQLTEVEKAEDFNGLSGGGCRLMCNETLDCGHICNKKCHVRGHIGYRCQEICNKVMCIRAHKCQKHCWEACGDCMIPFESNLPCGHTAKLPCQLDPKEYNCPELVSVKLPDCGHTNEKQCHTDVKDAPCSFPCDIRLPCGHVCTKKCHVNSDPEHLEYKCLKPCTQKNLECKDEHICQKLCFEECGACTVKVKRKLPNCDHYFKMECSIDPSSIKCDKPCNKKLDCGHKCPRKCKDPCGGCREVVEKEIPDCQHKLRMKCCDLPLWSMCKEKCPKTLSCGHVINGICGKPCNEYKCELTSNKSARALCGHDVSLFCHEVNTTPTGEKLMERCKEACNKILECSHKCKGTCGQCMQGRIHILCQEKCERKLICGHKCMATCSQSCPQCKEDCIIRCEHTNCKKKCGKPCHLCKEKCGWQCEHQTCSKRCSDLCDRPPCNEPCKKKLNCGHKCIGFCGEKCPDLCQICNPKEVNDILAFHGINYGRISRFILLPDCGHVFEFTELEKLLGMWNTSVVKMLECPQCKLPIQQAYRYKNAAKMQFSQIMQVKLKLFSNLGQMNYKLNGIAKQLWHLTRAEEYKKSWSALEELQSYIRRNAKAHYGAGVLNALEVRAAFVITVAEHFNKLRNWVNAERAIQECTKSANDLIRKILNRLDSITMQEHSDYEGECMRFHLLMKLRTLESSNEFKTSTRTTLYPEYEKCRVVVEDVKAFPKDKYGEVNEKINNIHKMLCTQRGRTMNVLELRSRPAKGTLIPNRCGLFFSVMKKVGAPIHLHQGHQV